MKIILGLFISLTFLLSSTSYQGYSGLINTPNSNVLSTGEVLFGVNNSFNNHLRYYNYDAKVDKSSNYFLGIGFLENFEVFLRLTENSYVDDRFIAIRDLSANFKYRLPIKYKYLPNIAIGWQDMGGANSFFGNKYFVLDKEFYNFFSLSLGYGKSSTDRDKRMDGIFGGAVISPLSWLSLIYEYDTKEHHIGAEVKKDFNEWNIGVKVAQNITQKKGENNFFGVTLSYKPNRIKKRIHLDEYIPNIQTSKESKKYSLNELENILVKIGFENIEIGKKGNEIFIAIENSVFLRNDLDALDTLFEILSNGIKNYNRYTISIKKSNIDTIILKGDISLLKNYSKSPNLIDKKSIKSLNRVNRKDFQIITKNRQNNYFIPRLSFSPVLKTYYGTEVGVFDYALGVRANLYATLYKGAILNISGIVPLNNSENFNKGKAFYSSYKERLDTHIDEVMFHQAFYLNSILNLASVGIFRKDYYGGMFESGYSYGKHRFSFKAGYFDSQTEIGSQIAIASYRKYWEDLNLFTEVQTGRYWANDTGTTLSLKRYFNNIGVSLYYKKGEEGSFAGLSLSIPLTQRKASRSKYLQVQGVNDFTHSINTRVGENHNNIAIGVMDNPTTSINLNNYYRNRDRVDRAYILNSNN